MHCLFRLVAFHFSAKRATPEMNKRNPAILIILYTRTDDMHKSGLIWEKIFYVESWIKTWRNETILYQPRRTCDMDAVILAKG